MEQWKEAFNSQESSFRKVDLDEFKKRYAIRYLGDMYASVEVSTGKMYGNYHIFEKPYRTA